MSKIETSLSPAGFGALLCLLPSIAAAAAPSLGNQVDQAFSDGSGVLANAPLAADVDGDGATDLVFVGQDWSGAGLNIRTKISTGDGGYWSAAQVLGDGSALHEHPPMVGDVDGDGMADLVFVGQNWSGAGLNIRTKFAQGDGTWSSSSQVLGDGSGVHTHPSLTGDFDGDGRMDIAFVGQNWSGSGLNIRTKFSRGDGTWSSSSQVLGDGSGVHTYAPLAGDVDGDGLTDLVFVGQNWSGPGLNIRTKFAQGDGTWSSSSHVLGDGSGVHAHDALTGDFDGDGRMDIAFVGQNWSGSGLNIRTKFSRGDGTWWSGSDVLGDGPEVHALPVQVVDANGDGRSDLLFVSQERDGSYRARVKISQGDGTWTGVSSTIDVPGADLLVGDANVDGISDLLLPYADAGALRVQTWLGQEAVPYSESLDAIQAAYRNHDGHRFQSLVTYELQALRKMSPDRCLAMQDLVIQRGCSDGFDGLEALLLAQQDCAAQGDVDSSYAANVQTELATCLWYAETPAITDHQPLGAYNETTIEAVRTDALRTLLDGLTRQPTATAAALGLDILPRLEDVASARCQLPLMVDQYGDTLPGEVLRKASCRLTGIPAAGMLDTLAICATHVGTESVTDQAAVWDGGNTLGSDVVRGVDPLSTSEQDLLTLLCEGLGSGGSASTVSPGTAGLAPHSALSCFIEGDEEDRMQTIAELTAECIPGMDAGNPFADGDSATDTDDDLDDEDPPTDTDPEGNGDDTVTQVKAFFTSVFGNMLDALLSGARSAGGRGAGGAVGVVTGPAVTLITTSVEDLQDHITGLIAIVTGRSTVGGTSGILEKAMKTNRLPGGDGIDLTNSSCMELVEIFSGQDSEYWDDFYGRDTQVDPRKATPHPDDESGSDAGDEMSCTGTDPYGSSQCNSVAMCAPGYELDDTTCTCERMTEASVTLLCPDVTCDDGSVPTPVGPGICMCMEEDSFADPMPQPAGPVDSFSNEGVGSDLPGEGVEELPGREY